VTISSHSSNVLPDAELVSRFRNDGDMQALGELFERYMELVYGVCLKYLRDRDLAQDAVMDIFEALAGKLPRFEVQYFRAWLYQVARNYCLMQLRKEKTRGKTIDLMHSESIPHHETEDPFEREADLQQMEDCVSRLLPDQQEMITLFYLEGHSYQKIAEKTGKPWNQVRSHIQNGRRNLKICMENQTRSSDIKRHE
jgi:RNA polymerase sigma factor (sigma-70 family)